VKQSPNFRILAVLGLAALLLALAPLAPAAGQPATPPGPANTGPAAAEPGAAGGGAALTPLEDLLTPDGTLDLAKGFSGSLDMAGWEMRTAADGAPRFVRAGGAPAAPAARPALASPDDYWDARFSIPGVDGVVEAIALSGANLYIGGNFSSIGPVSANNIAKWDGGAWSALGSGIGLAGNGVNSTVNALAVSGNNLYVGGSFSTAYDDEGVNVPANHIALWNGSAWSALGSGGGNGVSDVVEALALSGANLYVGGFFVLANVGAASQVAANGIALWNGSAWSTLGSGGGNGVNGTVAALVLSGTNSLYVGGSFTTANVGAASPVTANHVALWNGSAWSALGSGGGNGVSDRVNALALNGSSLYVGGAFTTTNLGAVSPVAASHVARWNGATSVWSPLGSGGGNGVDGDVYALAVNGSSFYVGGAFSVANVGAASPATATHIAFWSGSAWSALGSGGNGVDSPVYALALGGGNLYVGGSFKNANAGGASPVAANGIALWNGAWSSLNASIGFGADSSVRALALSGGNLYVGGSFRTVYNGATGLQANFVAMWNGNLWSPLGSDAGPTGNGVNSTVFALAVSGSSLFVGGFFTTAYNSLATQVNANRVARWDGATWSPLGGGAGPTGNGVNSTVFALAVSGSSLFVGGTFITAYNSLAAGVSANYIAMWDGSLWSPLGTGTGGTGNGVNGQVNALAVSGSNLFVGGSFSTGYNSPATAVGANNVAMWNAGSGWSRLGSGAGTTGNGVNGPVGALAMSGSNLFVGGGFITVYNSLAAGVSANHIAMWDAASSVWSPLGTGTGGTGNGVNRSPDVAPLDVSALAVSGNNLFVGGFFITAYNSLATGVRANDVAMWNGSAWSALGSGTSNIVHALAATAAGELYAGGDFSFAGNKPSASFGRYFAPEISINDAAAAMPASGTLPVTFTVSLGATSPFSLTVAYATADGTAHANSDYVPASGTVTIPAGGSSATLPIFILGGSAPGPSKTFTVNLSSPSGGTIARAQGTGTILNTNPTPTPTPTPGVGTFRAFLPLLRR
jgi:hypothetical protein